MSKYKTKSVAPTLTFLPKSIPQVTISANAETKMALYVDECSDEIGWLGSVVRDGNHFHIDDVYLFRQEVHATTTEITPEGLEEFATALLERPDGVDLWNRMKLWGHSHVNMGVTPSGQDDSTMKQFGDAGNEYFIRLIANKKGEMNIDVFLYDEGLIWKNVGYTVESVEVDVDLTQAEAQYEALVAQAEALKAQMDALYTESENRLKTSYTPLIKEEMKELVTKKSYTSTRTYYGSDYSKNPIVSSWGRNTGNGWKNWDIPLSADEFLIISKAGKLFEVPEDVAEVFMNRDTDDTSARDHKTGERIRTIADVYQYFTNGDLEEIGACTTLEAQYKEIDDIFGKDFFDIEEKMLIAQEADQVFADWNSFDYQSIKLKY